MSHEPDNSTDRLTQAVKEFRQPEIDPPRLLSAETRIMSRMRQPRSHMRAVVFASSAIAAATCGVILLAPSKSLAAELGKIAHNGDVGLRHVTQWAVKPDGSRHKVAEFYAKGDRARLIFEGTGEQVVYTGNRAEIHRNDGAVVVQHLAHGSQAYDWVGFTANAVLARSQEGSAARTSVERGVTIDGHLVDRFTSDTSFVDGKGDTLRSRVVLLADPATERPIREEVDTTGFDHNTTTWDYPTVGDSLLDGPTVDPNRIYDEDSEHTEILAALDKPGQVKIVQGHRVELCELWIDEKGNAAAIAKADYAYPSCYSIKLNGRDVGTKLPALDPSRYNVVKPWAYHSEQSQIFWGSRSGSDPVVTWPALVNLDIPVIANSRVVGYASFKHVAAHRAWNLAFLLQPMNVPFWVPNPPPTQGSAAVAAANTTQP